MDAGINNVIYMELHSGPKMVNGTCRKTIVAGTIDRGSTLLGTIIKICHEHSSLLNLGQKCHALYYKTQEFFMLFADQQHKTELTVAFPWQHF